MIDYFLIDLTQKFGPYWDEVSIEKVYICGSTLSILSASCRRCSTSQELSFHWGSILDANGIDHVSKMLLNSIDSAIISF